MLIGSISSLEMLEDVSEYLDGFVVYSSDFSSAYKKAFSKEELKDIYQKRKDMQMMIDISFMLEDHETEAIKSFLLDFKEDSILFICSDLGVYQIMKDLHMEQKAIYNPNTLITNDYDMNFYLDQGMNAIGISLEIPLEDQIQMISLAKGKTMMQVFGYHVMFHSKRLLLDLYQKHCNISFEIDNQNSFLIEQTRKDKYPIFQSFRGTLLFRSYVLSFLKEIKDIKATYLMMEDIFIDSKDYLKEISLFSKVLKNEISLEEALKMEKEIGFKMEDGFKYKDTVYQKEKSNE